MSSMTNKKKRKKSADESKERSMELNNIRLISSHVPAEESTTLQEELCVSASECNNYVDHMTPEINVVNSVKIRDAKSTVHALIL